MSHSYADDVQSYAHCSAKDAAETVRLMVRSTDILTDWLSSNRLRLNSSKTQYIWLGTRQQLAKLDLASLSNAFPHISFSSSVRDLGIILDQELSFSKHISTLSRTCFYQLRQLRVVARSLSFSAASALVHAFISSRLDYCSSLYVGLPQVRLNSLIRVQRSAARLVGGFSRFDHVSSFMKDILHWLPLQQRILFRVSSIVWHCILGQAPSYLCELFILVSTFLGRLSLRSATRGDFLVPFARTSTMQRCAFSVVGPSVWNDLPPALRLLPRDSSGSFYSRLKTFLFEQAWVGSASE
jgi:hypothetical protein